MARKKGSMSLKDFHGGEIRSDLPLPSKPGVTNEPSIKSSFGGERGFTDPSRERFVPSYGRSDVRTPPQSDRSYFPDPSSIGKNYEEDERKPVGVGNATRPEGLGSFSAAAPAYPSHLVTERFPPSGGGYSSRLADLPSTPPQKLDRQSSPPKAEQRPKLHLQPRGGSFDDDDSADVSITPGVQVLTIGRNAFKESEQPERVKSGTGETDGGVVSGEEERPRERPKLNLKPRSQDVGAKVEEGESRPGVFGGARPRDVVLKERGVDEAVIMGVEEKVPTESPPKEAVQARVASPDQSKWGKRSENPREDRYVKAEDQRWTGGRDSDPRENGPARNGWGEKPGAFQRTGRPENGFERQGSGGSARSGHFGDTREKQWRSPKPASPPIRSALVDTSVRKDPWEAPLTSLQLAEAFSRSTSSGSPGQSRGSAAPVRGSGQGYGNGAPGRGNDRFAWAGGNSAGGRAAGGGFGGGRGPSSFGRDGYRRNEHEYRGPPRSQVYQDDERG